MTGDGAGAPPPPEGGCEVFWATTGTASATNAALMRAALRAKAQRPRFAGAFPRGRATELLVNSSSDDAAFGTMDAIITPFHVRWRNCFFLQPRRRKASLIV